MKTLLLIIATGIISNTTFSGTSNNDLENTNEITFEEVYGNYQEPVFTPVDEIVVLEEVEDVTLEQDIEDLAAVERFLHQAENITFGEVFEALPTPTFTSVDQIQVVEEEEEITIEL